MCPQFINGYKFDYSNANELPWNKNYIDNIVYK